MIFGPIDDYSLAPVSRFAGVWGIPIVSPGGFAEAFTITKQVYICTQFLFLSAPFIIFIFFSQCSSIYLLFYCSFPNEFLSCWNSTSKHSFIETNNSQIFFIFLFCFGNEIPWETATISNVISNVW